MIKPSILTILPFFLALFLVLFLFFPKFPGGLINWDNNPTVLLPIAIIRDHTFLFNQFKQGKEKLAVDRSDLDSYYYFVVDSENQVLSGYPIFPGLLMIPVYLGVSIFFPNIWQINSFPDHTLILLGSLCAALLTTATAFILFLTIWERTKILRLGLLGCGLFVFATPVISVSSRFVWQHTFALFFLSLVLYCVQKNRLIPLLLVAILAALCRPQTILLSLPLFFWTAYRLHNLKKIIRFDLWDYACGFLLTFALSIQIFYSVTYLHGVFKLAPLYDPSLFSANILLGLTGILFSPAKGLFFYSPMFLISVLCMYSGIRHRANPEYYAYGIGLILFTLMTAMWKAWSGGWSLGYRLMLETTPILIILLTDFLARHKIRQNPATLLVISSVLVSILFNTQITGEFGECGFHGKPTNIDNLRGVERLKRLWLDSPIFRCVKLMQASSSQ